MNKTGDLFAYPSNFVRRERWYEEYGISEHDIDHLGIYWIRLSGTAPEHVKLALLFLGFVPTEPYIVQRWHR